MSSIFDSSVVINGKVNLLNMNRKQLRMFFSSLGEATFRADQVMKWIYHYYCNDFDCMTDIRRTLREKLKQISEIRAPTIINKYCSYDGTIKWCFQIGAEQIETVYIPKNIRATLCISSQIGCSLQCTFCSTGKQGFNRNLRVSEIIGQVWEIVKIINSSKFICLPPITNIVIMGMGEPLLNFNNVVTAIEIMLDDCGFGLSKRRIVVSTSGVVPAINKLADMLDVSLAVSLHAPNDLIRNKIMPINRKWNIRALLGSVKYYLSKSRISRNRVTIEYVMLDHINDDVNCAYQLVKCLDNISCKVNLIPWNPIPSSCYRCSSKVRMNQFFNILLKAGLVTTIREVRGNDISAACGQLVGVVNNRKNNFSFSKRKEN